MKKFYTGIVNHRRFILAFFLAATICCAFLQSLVSVNYDITDYLPPEAPSSLALDVMEEEFDSGIPNARIMIRDVSIAQALNYKEQLKNIDGVQEVTWLDDTVDVTIPLEMMDQAVLDTYYKDNTAL